MPAPQLKPKLRPATAPHSSTQTPKLLQEADHNARKALLRRFDVEREAAKARILAVGRGLTPPPPAVEEELEEAEAEAAAALA